MSPFATQFKLPISTAEITALKSFVESIFFGVGFEYSGSEFSYDVKVMGPEEQFKKTINHIFPKGKQGITIQRSQLGF